MLGQCASCAWRCAISSVRVACMSATMPPGIEVQRLAASEGLPSGCTSGALNPDHAAHLRPPSLPTPWRNRHWQRCTPALVASTKAGSTARSSVVLKPEDRLVVPLRPWRRGRFRVSMPAGPTTCVEWTALGLGDLVDACQAPTKLRPRPQARQQSQAPLPPSAPDSAQTAALRCRAPGPARPRASHRTGCGGSRSWPA